MNEKGNILIIEDRIQEKIGSFYDQLIINGYNIKIAETLEEANEILNDLLKSNNIDGIILDFAFPVSQEDQSTNIEGIPCGIQLLKDYSFKLGLRSIPIVINTTSDESHKTKFLENMNLSMPIYNVNHDLNPLSKPSGEMIKEIMNMFDTRNSLRNVKPDSKWFDKGGAFIRDKNGKILGYRYK